jgi:hypothetical protein
MSRIAAVVGRMWLAATVAVALACSTGDTTGPGLNILQGLVKVPGDTSTAGGGGGGGTTNCNLPTDGPGFFQGDVVGFVAGPDSGSTATPLANVKITADKALGSCGAQFTGDQVAVATTDATGHFELATIPGGDYLVTVISPDPYNGAYALATASSTSGSRAWYVMLRHK